MNLGKNIANLRKEAKLSQEELAEILNVSRQTISNWELSETFPSSSQLLEISAYFKITPNELLGIDNTCYVIDKINKTEKLVKKQIKFTKIIFITIYILILFALVGYIIYTFTNKDFTKSYQGDFYCEIKNDEIYKGINVSLIPGGGKNYNWNTNEMVEHDNIYKVLVTEYKQNGESDEYYLSVGYSYKEAIDSLNYLKKTILDNGGICH